MDDNNRQEEQSQRQRQLNQEQERQRSRMRVNQIAERIRSSQAITTTQAAAEDPQSRQDFIEEFTRSIPSTLFNRSYLIGLLHNFDLDGMMDTLGQLNNHRESLDNSIDALEQKKSQTDTRPAMVAFYNKSIKGLKHNLKDIDNFGNVLVDMIKQTAAFNEPSGQMAFTSAAPRARETLREQVATVSSQPTTTISTIDLSREDEVTTLSTNSAKQQNKRLTMADVMNALSNLQTPTSSPTSISSLPLEFPVSDNEDDNNEVKYLSTHFKLTSNRNKITTADNVTSKDVISKQQEREEPGADQTFSDLIVGEKKKIKTKDETGRASDTSNIITEPEEKTAPDQTSEIFSQPRQARSQEIQLMQDKINDLFKDTLARSVDTSNSTSGNSRTAKQSAEGSPEMQRSLKSFKTGTSSVILREDDRNTSTVVANQTVDPSQFISSRPSAFARVQKPTDQLSTYPWQYIPSDNDQQTSARRPGDYDPKRDDKQAADMLRGRDSANIADNRSYFQMTQDQRQTNIKQTFSNQQVQEQMGSGQGFSSNIPQLSRTNLNEGHWETLSTYPPGTEPPTSSYQRFQGQTWQEQPPENDLHKMFRDNFPYQPTTRRARQKILQNTDQQLSDKQEPQKQSSEGQEHYEHPIVTQTYQSRRQNFNTSNEVRNPYSETLSTYTSDSNQAASRIPADGDNFSANRDFSSRERGQLSHNADSRMNMWNANKSSSRLETEKRQPTNEKTANISSSSSTAPKQTNSSTNESGQGTATEETEGLPLSQEEISKILKNFRKFFPAGKRGSTNEQAANTSASSSVAPKQTNISAERTATNKEAQRKVENFLQNMADYTTSTLPKSNTNKDTTLSEVMSTKPKSPIDPYEYEDISPDSVSEVLSERKIKSADKDHPPQQGATTNQQKANVREKTQEEHAKVWRPWEKEHSSNQSEMRSTKSAPSSFVDSINHSRPPSPTSGSRDTSRPSSPGGVEEEEEHIIASSHTDDEDNRRKSNKRVGSREKD